MRARHVVRGRTLGAAGLFALLLTPFLLLATGRPGAAAGETQAAVQRGINYLIPDANSFGRNARCIACHRQGGALFGLSFARSKGYAVNDADPDGIGELAGFISRDQRPEGFWIHEGFYFKHTKTSWATFGLAGYDEHVSTRYSSSLVKAADWLRANQRAEGFWPEDYGAFPVNYGNVPCTARDVIGMARARQYVDPSRAAAYTDSINKAIAWIRSVKDNTAQDVMGLNFEVAWAILAFKAAGVPADDPDLLALKTRLLGAVSTADPNAWGYRPTNTPDEYTTGLTLFALSQVGLTYQDAQIRKGVDWLVAHQIVDQPTNTGYWVEPGQSSHDIPTTFAILGLSVFGDYGVAVDPISAASITLDAGFSKAQKAVYSIRVTNTGAFDRTDRYRLTVQGGFPGWTGTLSKTEVSLDSGAHEDLTFTVNVPANQPQSLDVDWTILAVSQTDPNIAGSARLTTRTNPPPPITGLNTITTLAAGAGGSVTLGQNAITLSATLQVQGTSEAIKGPNKGVVQFRVAGVVVGADSDSDSDGVFTYEWAPGSNWINFGEQDLRAVYSGIDLAEPTPDLLGSVAQATLFVNPNPVSLAGINPSVGKQGQTLDVSLLGTGFAPGVTVSFGAGVIVNRVTAGPTQAARGGVRPYANQTLKVNVTVDFQASPGLRDITINNPDGSHTIEPDGFTVTAAAAGGVLAFTPESGVNFGKISTRMTKKATLTVRNLGKGTLAGSLSLPNGAYRLSPAIASFTLGAKKSQRWTLYFSSQVPGNFDGDLVVRSTDPRRKFKKYPLKGTVR